MFNFKPIENIAEALSSCPGCLQPAVGLCEVCCGFLPAIEHSCQLCALPIPSEEVCGHCLKKPPVWQQALAPWTFDGLTRFLIHQFKYNNDRAAGHALVNEWITATQQQRQPVDALLAVPMHHKRHAQKGMNQADLLAKYFSKKLNLPRFKGMQRTKATQPLEGLTRKERQRELHQAFELTNQPPKRIAIIDDVLTTGATATAIATILKQNGCDFIAVWALTRTPHRGRNHLNITERITLTNRKTDKKNQ